MSDQIWQPQDTLHLWFLGHPERPMLVGELNLVRSARGVSLRYAPGWLAQGFALSEDLPLIDIEHMPRERDCAAGAVEDARPDRWGERVIRHIERPSRLSLLEMLFFAGDDRFGALGISVSAESYQPYYRGVLPGLADVDTLHAVVRQVIQGAPVDESLRRLVAPGATMGGARPKALIRIDGHEWVLKFGEEGHEREPLIEHATMTLAARAGITVAQTRIVPLAQGMAVAVRRFDRESGRRLHALSAHVALPAAGSELSYPDLALLLRRRGDVRDDLNRRQMRELFRRLVFNILMDNTDDHEKNHALLVNERQQYLLAPAYDVLPMGQSLAYQAMMVGEQGAESSVDNAWSRASAYGLSLSEARAEATTVAAVVEGWQAHFSAAGVPDAELQQLAPHIDSARLLRQRRMLARIN